MQAERRIKSKVKVKLEEAERRQEPPVLRRELLLHARSVSKIRLLEGCDKNDKMIKMMVPMSTGEGRPAHCRMGPQKVFNRHQHSFAASAPGP